MGTTEVLNGSDLFVNSSAAQEDNNILPNYYAVWLYNEKIFEANMPVMTFLVVMSILGIFGNGSVVYIYSCRFKRNTMNYFILLLGISDVVGSLTLTFEAIDRRFPMYSGNLPVLCKIVRFVGSIVNIWSVGILVCIAFDRYYKICHPMKSFTMSKAKKMATIVIIVGCISAWPISIFHGPEMVQTGIPGVYGMDCADDDNYKELLVRPLYFIALLVGNLVAFTIMVVLYSLLYKEIWKWKHLKVGEDLNRIKSVRSISNESMDNIKHIHFSESDEVFVNHSASVRDLSELNGVSLGIPIQHNNVFKKNGVQHNTLDIPMMSKHSSSLESCHSLSSNGDTDQPDGTEIYQQYEHKSQHSGHIGSQSSVHGEEGGGEGSHGDGEEGGHLNLTFSSGEEGGHLNLTFSSSESDKTDISTKQNSTIHIPNSQNQNGHLFVTHLTVRNTPDSSVQSTPRDTDHIIRTKSTSLSSASPKPQRNGSTRQFVSVSTENSSPKSHRNGSAISHFSSISSAFRKRMSNKSNSSMKHRTPKSSASLAHSTLLFAVITMAFIFSYVPFFLVELLTSIGALNMNGDLPISHKQILRLCNSSFCFNIAINPIIYSILNPAFKKQLKFIFVGDKSVPRKR